MKIRDVMSKDVQVARPEDTLQTVAGRMAAGDFGFIPVADGDRLIGALTDRDIVVRAIAEGADPAEATVADAVEDRELKTVTPDQSVDDVIALMREEKVRRIPVVQDGRAAGIVSIGDLVKHRLELVEHEAEAMRDYIRTA